MSGTQIATAEAVIDNGAHGTRTVTFETGRLARQAAGSVTVSLDGGTLLLSATTASKNPSSMTALTAPSLKAGETTRWRGISLPKAEPILR